MNDKQNLGKLGEEIVAKYLKRNGYKIVEKNYKNNKLRSIIVYDTQTKSKKQYDDIYKYLISCGIQEI